VPISGPRQRLDLQTLRLIQEQAAWHLERHVTRAQRWLEGRSVKIVDGTSFSMPDTAANQAARPQPSGQKEGCGFPVAKLIGLFFLASGALLQYTVDQRCVHDSQLFRSLWNRLEIGDILLADRAFCSFGALASLLRRGVDSVMRLHQLRKVDWRRGRRLGPGDRLVTWSKPKQPWENWTKTEWAPATRRQQQRRVVIDDFVASGHLRFHQIIYLVARSPTRC
jgi:hypothetical protein